MCMPRVHENTRDLRLRSLSIIQVTPTSDTSVTHVTENLNKTLPSSAVPFTVLSARHGSGCPHTAHEEKEHNSILQTVQRRYTRWKARGAS